MISMQNASVYASKDYHRIARAIAFIRKLGLKPRPSRAALIY